MSPAFRRGGDVGRDLSAVDWEATPLGSPAQWPGSLTTIVRAMLASRFSMWMAWGDDLTFMCNDAYRRATLGTKYPWALGRPASEVWAEIWEDIGPRIESVLDDGVATWDESLMLFLERRGYREETYHTFSYSPLADDDGTIVGMLCVVVEETDRVLGERRLATLQDLSGALASAETEASVFEAFARVLDAHDHDLPFTATFSLDAGGDHAQLVALTGGGTVRDTIAAQDDFEADRSLDALCGGDEGLVELTALDGIQALVRQDWDRRPSHAVVLPLRSLHDRTPSGLLIAGLNAFRPPDETAKSFAGLVAGQLASALGTARAFDAERHRRQALEELDRAKTRFFNNVSHEFRTPLTLIMGPVGELQRAVEAGAYAELAPHVQIVHRNGLRLAKLVDTLLDFSRLQAGRVRVAYEPVHLEALTAELASAFQEAVDRAGLSLVVECDEFPDVVYVDPDMWERIVLNLLSNALKFTFEGSIELTLRREGTAAVLRVADTGIGIADSDLPHVFDRFHRIEHARGRSTEGSGIGLALVSELVVLHGGNIAVTSTVAVGSEFSVSVPLGRSHIDDDQILEPTAVDTGTAVEPFLQESLGWIPRSDALVTDAYPTASSERRSAGEPEGEVLVVDDNPDMRAYVARVLGRRFRVRVAASGSEALAEIEASPPDLVLTDVMMADIDGFELLRRIRDEPRYSALPVVFLTAQAGSEAELHGLDIGADDYLVKPFSAEDLLGRVSARLASGVERRHRQAVADLAGELLRAHDIQRTVAVFQTFAARWFSAINTSLAVVDDDTGLARMWHAPGFGRGITERSSVAALDAPELTLAPLQTGRRTMIASRRDLADADPAVVATFVETGSAALLAVPLIRATGEIRGSLVCHWDQPRRLAPDELALFERAAATINDTLERLAITEQEHRVLHEFQERLLDIDVRTTSAVVTARYHPAGQSLMVGGDWYDVIRLADGHLGFSIGDVVGKGLPAATVMAQLRSALGAAAASRGSPAEVVGMVDEYARHVSGALCATLTYLLLEPGGELSWTAAGHPPPLVADGVDIRFLEGGRTTPLATFTGRGPEVGRRRLPPGSLVVLYTDGLVERRDEEITVGFERLRASVRAHELLPIDELCDALLAAQEPPDGYADDVALLAFRIPGADHDRLVDSYPARPHELAAARQRLRAWLCQHPFTDEEIDDVVLAIGEASSNALEHGNRRIEDGVVAVEVTLGDTELIAAISDQGAWDQDSTRSVREGRGRGLTIMHALMDAVDVRHSRAGTSVVLRRAFPMLRAR